MRLVAKSSLSLSFWTLINNMTSVKEGSSPRNSQVKFRQRVHDNLTARRFEGLNFDNTAQLWKACNWEYHQQYELNEAQRQILGLQSPALVNNLGMLLLRATYSCAIFKVFINEDSTQLNSLFLIGVFILSIAAGWRDLRTIHPHWRSQRLTPSTCLFPKSSRDNCPSYARYRNWHYRHSLSPGHEPSIRKGWQTCSQGAAVQVVTVPTDVTDRI